MSRGNRCPEESFNGVPGWLRNRLRQKHQLDLTMRDITPRVDESRLCRRAIEHREGGKYIEAIETYAQAFRRILEILGQDLPESPHGSDWWDDDTRHMASSVLPNAILGTQWTLSSGLRGAQVLYYRILTSLESQSSTVPDTRIAHFVKELAKIHLETQYTSEWSSVTTKEVREGLRVTKMIDNDDELMQFYQGLGGLYVYRGFNGTTLDVGEGGRILQHLYDIQKQIFGSSDYRTIKTVDVLSYYYQ
ncbi:hypothetical protein GGR53DRAFT_525321 [Hypoxylon sp. FL1150]|nr:hypothetical protein GGR53DRAFT_525321 [Hypoxylon sp. FL1150]